MSVSICSDIQCRTSRVNPNVNYGLGVMMTFQYRFIGYNKCITLVGEVITDETVCVGTGVCGNLCTFGSLSL